MNTSFSRFLLLCAFTLTGVGTALAQYHGVINDPDGYTNVRAEQSKESAIVTKVVTGEVFEFEGGEGSEWWKVKLTSGKSGWMHQSRIRLRAKESEIPNGEEGDELSIYGRAHGIDYFALAKGAAKGEPESMKRYFAITDTDGGAAETHTDILKTVIHVLGDDALAAHLASQPLEYQLKARLQIVNDWVLSPFEPFGYLERTFPKTAALLCPAEVTAWESPDGKYVVHKAFSDALPRENCTVAKSEVLEKATNNLVADFSEDDMGTGQDREGRVLWSPDSKRFAHFTRDQLQGQTVVYAFADNTFEPVSQPEVDLPGRADDAELKEAALIHETVEPLAWIRPDVLQVRQHEYFERTRDDKSIQSIGRSYTITIDFGQNTAVAEKFDPTK